MLVCALLFANADCNAQQTLRFSGGTDEPLRGGVLVTHHGTRYESISSTSGDPEAIHVLYVVPTNGHRSGSSGSSGLDGAFTMIYDFETENGDILEADTLVIEDGSRVRMGRTSFELAEGNLFVVYVNDGPEKIHQVAERVIEQLESTALLAVYQRALPGDSLVQAISVLH